GSVLSDYEKKELDKAISESEDETNHVSHEVVMKKYKKIARKVVWSKTAVKRLNEIVAYLEKNAAESAAEKFVIKLDDLIEKLSKYLGETHEHPVEKKSI